jgi:hypothetical protein
LQWPKTALKKKAPYTSKYELKLRKNLIGCYTWSIALWVLELATFWGK